MKIKLPELSLKATGLTNLLDVDNHIRKLLGPVINQINVGKADEGELAEVVKVYATEEQLEESPIDDEPDYKLLGAIRFRKVYTQQHLSDDQLMVAYPLNLNIVDFPVRGETVFIQKIYDKFYYTDRVNQYNNPNNAASLGVSKKFNIIDKIKNLVTLDTAETEVVEDKAKPDEVFFGEYFKPNFNIRQLVPNEGDTLIQGRFGNTLRLGSVDNAPTIKLRAGQISDFEKFDEGNELLDELENKAVNAPLEENINLDGSSMWMTTDETVRLRPATLEDSNIYPTETAPEEFSGKQIILNSGRLIFNSKEDGILGFSNGPIDFSTLNTFGVSAKQGLSLYSPLIDIGRSNQTKNLTLSSNEVLVNALDGVVTNIANKIELLGEGKAGPSPAVRGDELKELLKAILDIMKLTSQSVQTLAGAVVTGLPAAVGGPPAVGAQVTQAAQVAGQITENILNDITARYELLPSITSKVVEIE